MSKNNTVLITGGAGFVGTNLINDLINKGITDDIIVIDNMSHGTFLEGVHDNKSVTFYRSDVRNRDNVFNIFEKHKPAFVFMFHGLVSIYDCDNDPSEAFSNNIMGSINVFDACLKYETKKITFSETSAMYEDAKSLPHIENDWNAGTVYATSKACLHLLAESYRKTKGLTYTGLRYFNIAGPLQDYQRTIPPLFAGVALRLMNNKGPIIFGDETRRRDFIHVDDVNDFHIKCIIDARTDNEVFNLGRGESSSLREIVEIIYEYLDKQIPIVYKPEINGEAHTICANIDKAKALGWEPKKTIEDMIKDTIDFLVYEIKDGKVGENFMEDIDFDSVKIGK